MRARRSFPLSEVYTLLEPGPVVLLTVQQREKANVMTMSWHTMLDFEPPLIGCVLSDQNYSFKLLKATKECVINIPTVQLAQKVVACGNTSGRDIDKFSKFRLTRRPASFVNPPMLDECYANLECRVVDTKMAIMYNFFILKVIKAWIDPSRKNPKTIHHQGRGIFMVAGRTLRLSSKMK